MAAFVDNRRIPYRRMLMSHLLADTLEELHGMADKIGVSRRHFQHSRSGIPHYDICQSKRALAIKHGAKEADRGKMSELIRHWKQP